jgi:phosphoglycerate dehydrogenase-like enzyme
LPERGVRASNARGVFDTAIAEWNIAMMVNLARNLRQMIRHQDAGVWDRAACFQTEIRGATVGLWGYGGIARQTARLCKSLGLRVHALTRSGRTTRDNAYCVENSGDVDGTLPDRIFGMAEKFDFLSDLDFLILCTPHTAQTEGMVGAAELDALPERAYLLNPARGVLVQEGPLIAALRSNSIAGAAIDTHYQYPLPPEHPLWKMRNVILTPHISGSSQSPYFLNRIWDLFVQNVARLHAGEPLLNELSPRELLNLS